MRDALFGTRGNASCGGYAVQMANDAGYDRIIVLTDGQWHYSKPGSTSGWHGDKIGEATQVSPAPLTERAYMLNVAAYKNGVGYGKWTSIDGWSEAVIDYVRASEITLD